jgi:hypothetical protein
MLPIPCPVGASCDDTSQCGCPRFERLSEAPAKPDELGPGGAGRTALQSYNVLREGRKPCSFRDRRGVRWQHGCNAPAVRLNATCPRPSCVRPTASLLGPAVCDCDVLRCADTATGLADLLLFPREDLRCLDSALEVALALAWPGGWRPVAGLVAQKRMVCTLSLCGFMRQKRASAAVAT